ncbi:hypothetical protein KL866_19380 [Alteromonas sp. ALT199]|uniref:hypothetical protein n=1 Tax=unclassified Alteromonas TaxID=2614992 RepID=UPI001BEBA9F1|nr:hypothetical protein [Alteromonas sp. ALT199]MBT3137217.1 hypothetical protein [Alteromonas sp. ALT199]
MKISRVLFFVTCFFSQTSYSDDLLNKVNADVRVIKAINLPPHGSGKIEISTDNDLWVGFNFEFPQAMVVSFKKNYILEIKDKNSYASVSTGPTDNGASTIFKEKDGQLAFTYKNNTNLEYKVIFWVRSI